MPKKYIILALLLTLMPGLARAADTFNRNLYFGLHNDTEIIHLQDFLRGLNFFTYPVSTGNYLTATREAVRGFQKANNIMPASGYFGPKTRLVANRIIAANASPIPQPGGPTSGTTPLSSGSAVNQNQSPYKDKIGIGYAYGSGLAPEYQTIYIENRSDIDSYDITGFKLVTSHGESYTLPKGHLIPELYPIPDDPIIVRPYGRAIITAGKQEKNINFQTNLCSGYLAEISQFIPSIPHSCPRIDTSNLPQLSDKCVSLIEASSGTCQAPDITDIYENDCVDFMSQHMNYAGCVKDNRSNANFYSGEWYFWMQRENNFFKSNRETVFLKDREGKDVDSYVLPGY